MSIKSIEELTVEKIFAACEEMARQQEWFCSLKTLPTQAAHLVSRCADGHFRERQLREQAARGRVIVHAIETAEKVIVQFCNNTQFTFSESFQRALQDLSSFERLIVDYEMLPSFETQREEFKVAVAQLFDRRESQISEVQRELIKANGRAIAPCWDVW